MDWRNDLKGAYRNVRQACRRDWLGEGAGVAIGEMAALALRFLAAEAERVDLSSSVAGKRYVSYSRDGVVARPANRELFETDWRAVVECWRKWLRGREDAMDFGHLAYTVALAPCLALELLNRNNKKGPATYFECLVGHLVSRSLGVGPARQPPLEVFGQEARMTMDFLFETAGDSGNIHVPIKMSTRERIVQAWAHQRILDEAFGKGHYRGEMVLFSETKLNSKTLDVVEICVPSQWLVYQTLIAKMNCIYYFDTPVRYRELADAYPQAIQIKPIREAFTGTAAFGLR